MSPVSALAPARPVEGTCCVCSVQHRLDAEGLVEVHTHRGRECWGGRLTPAEVQP